jgi:electron transfer flavoprotein alpha subunit
VKIVCLVKQIPHPASIEFDQETKSLRREGVPLVLNELDRQAVLEAVRLREAAGGEVVVMTMGPPQAEEALRECLAVGADRAIHLSDRVFALADTIGTSRTLALAIQKEGGADLVICGRKTLDSETWQVPPEVAAFLGWPVVTSVAQLSLEDGALRARRETDEGDEVYEVPLPAVLSVARTEAEPDAGTADGPIDLWTANDLAPDVRPNDKRFGQSGSPTRVLAVRDVTPERAGLEASSPAEAAEAILRRLAETEPEPSAWAKPDRLGEQPGASYDCWTAVELVSGRPTRLSLELLGKGRELAGKLGGRNVALVLGHDLAGAAAEAARYGAESVYLVDDSALAQYHPEVWGGVLVEVLRRYRPHVLLIPASARGREYGPFAAGQLELGMTGDCVNLGIDRAGRLIQTKPAYGGNIVSVIMGATTPQLATVRARMFEPLEPREDVDLEQHRVPLETVPTTRVRLVDSQRHASAYELDEADVALAVGAGIAPSEVEPHAQRLGATVAGTRESQLPETLKVGLLGRPIAPRLYIAVGAEGGFEHLTGTVKAGVIATLDSAPDLPTDVRLPGNWRQTLPTLVDALAGNL